MPKKLTAQQKAERSRTAARVRGVRARKATNALDKAIISGRILPGKKATLPENR